MAREGARKSTKQGTRAPTREKGLPKAQPNKAQRQNAPTNPPRSGESQRGGVTHVRV